MYSNNEVFEAAEFGSKATRRESSIEKHFISDKTPSYFHQYVQSNVLYDNSDYINFGSAQETSYFNAYLDLNIIQSSWNTFPTKENPMSKFKFASFYVEKNQDYR